MRIRFLAMLVTALLAAFPVRAASGGIEAGTLARHAAEDDLAAAKTLADWFRKTAIQGQVAAMNLLGVILERGSPALRDLGEAVKWYRLASETGDARSQASLGVMLLAGIGTDPDPIAGRVWLEKAAAQNEPRGHKQAREALARARERLPREGAESSLPWMEPFRFEAPKP